MARLRGAAVATKDPSTASLSPTLRIPAWGAEPSDEPPWCSQPAYNASHSTLKELRAWTTAHATTPL